MTLMLHHFKVENSSNYENFYVFLSLRQHIQYFIAYSICMKDFDDIFIVVSPLTKEARAKICHLEYGISSICSNIFHKYWLYSYKEEYLSQRNCI